MTAKIIPLALHPKLRGVEPSSGDGFYVDAEGNKKWVYTTDAAGEAISKWQSLEDSGWWDRMNYTERSNFHVFNARNCDALAAGEYRRYVEFQTNIYEKLDELDNPSGKQSSGKNKTPSGGNR